MNRLTRTWSSGNSEESYTTYDLLGRVSTRSTASGGNVAYVYDQWNRVAQLTVNGETVSYTSSPPAGLLLANRG
jgi:YD repeat-containing protein